MRKIVLTTDANAHDNRFPKGTGFVVKETPDPKAKPHEIDPRTADVWLQSGWAEDTDSVAKSAGNAG